jgi:RimJ/RimL family protein N-acetyltransferase
LPVTIRPATVDDADALASLLVAAWRSTYASLLPAEFLAGLDVVAWADRWREMLGDPGDYRALVGEEDGELAGFVSIGPDPERSPVGRLYALYVAAPRLGTGLGHELHEAGLQVLRDRGLTTVELWVLRGNERAIAFYERHGWSHDGRQQLDRSLPGVELDEIAFSRPL